MNLLRDKHIRYFSCFIIGYIILFFGCSTWLLSWQTDSARQMLLSRENTMISALLNQGVPEDVVAAAVANEEKSESGKAFLEKIGRGDNITASALPEDYALQSLHCRHLAHPTRRYSLAMYFYQTRIHQHV